MAKFNQPVPRRTTHLNKTEKMLLVDEVLKAKYEQIVRVRMDLLKVTEEDGDQKNILKQLYNIKAMINKKEEQLKNAKEFLRINDNDILLLLHEEVYQQDFPILDSMQEGAKSHLQASALRQQPEGSVVPTSGYLLEVDFPQTRGADDFEDYSIFPCKQCQKFECLCTSSDTDSDSEE
ncbi:hypothetical protein BGZ82_011310 [Podila clonocystis]|nr:hypothetical protein BGZ82_011310 [Podila clonocystis]